MTNEAKGQYKGWPRVVREMATHFLNSTLVENKLKLMTEKSENKSVPFYSIKRIRLVDLIWGLRAMEMGP